MALAGGYWFWFFIRVDVAAEGGTPLRVMRADLFILSLLASVTLGLVWPGCRRAQARPPASSSACTSSPPRCCSAGSTVQVRAHVLSPRRPSRTGPEANART